MTKYYIADCHFGHDAIIGFDGRPFMDSMEMNAVMTDNWNKTVKRSDDVYIIGDMFLGPNADEQIRILESLNGSKHLIEGNHDRYRAKVYQHYASVSQIKTVKDNNFTIFMCHYPIHTFAGHYREDVFHLYGHVHNTHEEELTQIQLETTHKYELGPTQMLNVGAMMPYMNYTPRTLDELWEAYEYQRKAQGYI